MANATNPLNKDLDAGGHAIQNASQVNAVWLVAGERLSVGGITIRTGPDNPAAGLAGDAGDFYSRVYPDSLGNGHAELWFKTGIQTTDWVKVAG